MIGSTSSDPNISIFAFSKEILGYDLAGFFEENSKKFKNEIHSTLRILLDAN